MVGSARLVIRLFGSLDARLDGVPLPGLRENRRAAHLLAFLAQNAAGIVEREWVAAQLSDDRGEFTLENLRRQQSLVRGMLGSLGDYLTAVNGTLSLSGTGLVVDTRDFDAAWAARREDPNGLGRIPDLYQGPLLQDWYEDWVQPRRDDYARKYLRCLQAFARQALEAGEVDLAMEYLERAADADPTSQQVQFKLMETLVKAREYPRALRLYERYRANLLQQGMPLATEMAALYEQIPRALPETIPLPASAALEIEPAGGAVPLRSRFYMARPADTECHAAISRRDSIVLLHGSRQVGKTSLLARGLEVARRTGAQVLLTDFQKFSEAELQSLDTFFLALAHRVAKALNLSVSPREHWDPDLAPSMNFEQFFLERILSAIPVPVVWGFDEVDRLFSCDYRGDVFSLFRSWHNERALSPGVALERLTLVLSYAIDANLFIPNRNQSPFNVGTSIALGDFSRQQCDALCRLHETPPDATERLFQLAGGHPYLTRSALYTMQTRGLSMDAIEAQADREDGPFGNHLRHLRKTLAQDPALQQVVKGVLRGDPCPSTETFYHLVAAGVLAPDRPEAPRLRCRLYESYLRKVLR